MTRIREWFLRIVRCTRYPLNPLNRWSCELNSPVVDIPSQGFDSQSGARTYGEVLFNGSRIKPMAQIRGARAQDVGAVVADTAMDGRSPGETRT